MSEAPTPPPLPPSPGTSPPPGPAPEYAPPYATGHYPPAGYPPPYATTPYAVPYQVPYGMPGAPARPPLPRVWTVFVVFVAAVIAGMAGPVIIALGAATARHGADLGDGEEAQRAFEAIMLEPPVFLSSLAATQAGLLGVTLFAAALSPVPWRRRLRLTRPRLRWHAYPVVIAGTLALGFGSSLAIELLGIEEQGALKMFADALRGMRGPLLIIAAAVIGLAPGFGEELLFRGYAQTRLTQRWGRFMSIGLTSLLFALIHMDLIQGAFVLLLGIWLGEVVERAGSIWPAVVCHTVNNSLSTLAAPIETSIPERWSLALLFASIIVLALCVWYVLRQPLTPPDPVELPPDYEPAAVPPYAGPPGPMF